MKAPEHHREFLNLVSVQKRNIDIIYNDLAIDLSRVLKKYKTNSNSKVWHKNKKVKQEVDQILNKYKSRIQNNVDISSANAWHLSNKHNDKFVDGYVKDLKVPDKYYDKNLKALAAFQARRTSGFALSKNVWNFTKQTREQMESFLAEGLTKGRSSTEMAKDLKRYLKEPDKRFRRIRNKETGKLMLSEPAKAYNPGRGVYRSSYQNALRLTRNEVNISYRTADVERRKNLPFVMGIKVNLSPSHKVYDICDEMQGDYPSDFVFKAWHPNCLCFTTSRLLSRKEFIEYLNGKKIPDSKRTSGIPDRASNYLNKNADKIKGYSNKPYFIQDNFKNTKEGFELKK